MTTQKKLQRAIRALRAVEKDFNTGKAKQFTEAQLYKFAHACKEFGEEFERFMDNYVDEHGE